MILGVKIPQHATIMPRGPRLDAPGTLHHVMVRGIEGSIIVKDESDRRQFVSRMQDVSGKTGTLLFAWALMTNHAHMLVKSGKTGISDFMRKLLTGYAIYYNKRHQRHGHLFQNRYKSIVCEEDAYFRKLVAYIHLNPIRAGLVGSLKELGHYPWSGHADLIRHNGLESREIEYVLSCFGDNKHAARSNYLDFLNTQMPLGRQNSLSGGGLIRSAGGWSQVLSMRQRGEQPFSDARILGSGEFAKTLINAAGSTSKTYLPDTSRLEQAANELELRCQKEKRSINSLRSGCRREQYTSARRELASRFVGELGLSFTEAARLLGVSASAVNQIIRRSRGR